MSPDDALIFCRTLQDASSVLLWGTCAYLSTLVPPALAGAIGRRLTFVRIAAIAVAAGTTFAALPLESSAIGDGWGGAIDLATVRSVVFDTNIGEAWLLQACAAIALVITVWMTPRRQFAAVALCAGLLLGCRALTGHSVMRAEAAGEVLQISYLIHVLSAGAWLGALVPLVLIFQQLGEKSYRQEAIVALRQFSSAGQVMVALAVCTGMANTLLILGHLPLVWSQPYERLLAMKICLVGGMVLIALVNRYVIMPRLKSSFAAGARLLLYTTNFELALGAGALVLVNLFGTFDPG